MKQYQTTGGDQIVTIDLMGSQNSNRFYVDDEAINIDMNSNYSGSRVTLTKKDKGYFSYELVGRLSSGPYVLLTASNGGGTGIFKNLLIVAFTTRYNLEGKRTVSIQKIGEIGLGDRWPGNIRIEKTLLL